MNNLASRLKATWENEIRIVAKLMQDEFTELRDPSEVNSVERLARVEELKALRLASTQLQEEYFHEFDTFTDELISTREQKRTTLKAAIGFIQTAQKKVESEKGEILDQLSESNRATAVFKSYGKR